VHDQRDLDLKITYHKYFKMATEQHQQ